MLWRLLRHRRLPHLRRTCYRPLQRADLPPRRHVSTNPKILPTIASVLASRPVDSPEGTTIEVVGSVRTLRRQKHRAFLELGDGSTVRSLQALLDPDLAQGLSTGALVAVTGVWRPSPPGKEQCYELHAQTVNTIGASDSERYPIQKKYQTPEFLRTIPHLRLRLPLQTLLARLRSESDFLLAQFFRERGFLRVQTPVITSSDCEGAGEVFSVGSSASVPSVGSDRVVGNKASTPDDDSFFRKSKFLTVSAQLHLEAYMQEHSKVWTFAPTFRAERSDTPRHVSEFWMLEVEMRSCSLEEIMDLVEAMIKSLVRGLAQNPFMEELMVARRSSESSERQKLPTESDLLSSRWEELEHGAWPRITYTRAMQLLLDSTRSGESNFVHRPDWESGLQLEHERYIAAKVGQGKPVYVTDYPQTIKPFYMLPSTTGISQETEAPPTAACFDLLLPELCEVVGGSLREHRLQELVTSMQRQDHIQEFDYERPANDPDTLPTTPETRKNLEWYIDLRRFGSVPHGGFGFGFDRFLCYLTGMRNIKDVIPWPRYHGRCDC